MIADELKILLRAETRSAVNAMKKAQRETNKMATGFNKMASIFKKVAGPLGIGLGAAAILKSVKDSIDAFKIQEQAEAKLNAALKTTGEYSEDTSAGLKAYASELQGVTTFGDETTISSMALLQQLAGLDKDGLKAVIPGMQDFAAAMGIDLQNAASLVGKTIGSTTNALARYGIEIDTTATKEEKVAQLTKAMNEKFGGTARAIADTATGSMEQLNNAIGDLKEQLGESVANGLQPFAKATTNIIEKYAEWLKKSKDIKDIMKDIGANGTSSAASIDKMKAVIAKYNDEITKATVTHGRFQSALSKEKIAEIAKLKVDRAAAQAQLDSMIQLKAAKAQSAALDARYAKEKTEYNKKLADAAKKQEQIAQDTLTRQKAQNDLIQKFKDINERVNAGLINGNGEIEKEAALRSTLNDLIDKGFTAQGRGFAKIIAAAKEYGVILSDTGKKDIEETKLHWLTKTDIAKKGYLTDEEWLADYYAKEKAARDKAIADTKAAWNEKLSIASDFTSRFQGLFDQLSSNELTSVTNTEDAKIKAIEDSYDNQLALMDKDSQAYQDLQDQKTAALKQAEDDKAAAIKTAKEKQWKIDKAFAVGKAIIDTISAVVEAAPNPWLMAAMGVLGAAQTAAIAAQPMPAFATGGSFVTNGATPIMTGDNASGQERVTVEPLGGGSQGNGTMILNIDGQQFVGWLQNKIDNRGIRIPRGSLV